MLNKAEAYFTKTFRERAGLLVVLTLLLLVPQSNLRFFFLFLMITLVLLPRDVHNGKIKLMMSLPLSRTDVFWSSYAFLITIAVITQLIGSAFVGMTVWGISGSVIVREILGTLIFSSAYFGVAMISVTFGFGNFGIPFLVFIADSFFGSIGENWISTYNLLSSPGGFNPYSMISPIYQGDQLAALIFAASLLAVAYIFFERKGTSK